MSISSTACITASTSCAALKARQRPCSSARWSLSPDSRACANDGAGPRGRPHRTAAGPARACEALDIDRSLSGLDLLSDPRLWLAADPGADVAPPAIVAGPRIGVDYAGPDWAARPWRFGVAGSPALSRPFPVAR